MEWYVNVWYTVLPLIFIPLPISCLISMLMINLESIGIWENIWRIRQHVCQTQNSAWTAEVLTHTFLYGLFVGNDSWMLRVLRRFQVSTGDSSRQFNHVPHSTFSYLNALYFHYGQLYLDENISWVFPTAWVHDPTCLSIVFTGLAVSFVEN